MPGYPSAQLPDPGRSVPAQLNSLAVRVGNLEGHTANLVKLTGEISEVVGRFRSYETTIRALVARGVLLIFGAVGGTYGVTRVTTPAQQPTRVEVVKSATTLRAEACAAMQPGPGRDRCAIDLLGELMGPRQR